MCELGHVICRVTVEEGWCTFRGTGIMSVSESVASQSSSDG
jgi:hypothetical protein